MSRHDTLDPTLTRPASDKRKAPSLIASSTVKKKRTSKKLLIQVRTPSPPEHNAIHHSDHLYLCMISDQNTATNGYYRFCQCLSTGKIFTILFFNYFSSLALTPTC
jgi:hypothetical protein